MVGFGVAALIGQASALTVRVDPAGGAPRLVVNGEPVRARMFWGGPGSKPMATTPSWQEISFEFIATGSANNGTMHLRFGQTPGDVYLDDIQVTDLDDASETMPRCDFEGGMASFKRDWTYWPFDAKNTVGTIAVVPGLGRNGSAALQVKLKAPADGHWPDFHVYHQPRLKIIQGHRYRTRLWVKSEPARNIKVEFYQPGTTFTRLGGPPGCFEEQIKLAAQAGVNFVSFPIGMPWPAPGKPEDWANVDAACEQVLRANPNALLIPRMGMAAPAWWRAAHPDDVMQWEDGRREDTVVASPQYRHDAAERLAALVRHLEDKFGNHVAGYHPCGQNTGEWFYQDTWKRPLNGYAPADLTAWRLWLKQRYANDTALRQSWSDGAVTLASASVPTAVARHAAPAGVFRDPANERALTDWAEFQQEAMADCVCELARAARQASAGKKLVVFFYGYVFEFAAVSNGPSTAGHYALRRALNSPDIDVLCSPISYFDRGLGQSAPSMTAAESVALTGKLWLNEDDTHTYLATGNQPGWMQHVATIEETNAELIRNVAQEALRNFGTWWMDLGSSGWFNDARMWREMQRLAALDEPLLKQPTPFKPGIAAIIDERSMLRVAAGGTSVTRPGIYEVRAPLGRMGAPYGQYLLDDVLAGRVHAKLYVFLNAWSLTAAERVKLLSATHGATRLWCYAPGYFEGDRIHLEAARELTGFTLKKVTPDKGKATPTEAGKRLGMEKAFGVEKSVLPLLAADASPSEVLATYPDGSAAVAMRRTPGGISIFAGAPGLTSELLRLAARQAGVHLFTETDCNIYANGPFIALHAAEDGPVTIDTGHSGVILDVLTGAKAGNGPKLTLPLKRGETKVLKY
ncbi:MAG: beta-galactosidase [Verrucomicrobiota bacterium]